MGTVSSNIHIFFEISMMTMSGRNAVDKMLGRMVDGGLYSTLKPSKSAQRVVEWGSRG